MAGSLSLSLSQQFDNSGNPLAGGKLYFFQSGTTTPQSAYQDSSLTIPHPNPIELDAGGRVPAFYLADGAIKIRLTDAAGVTILTADGLLVIGPSSGGGGGASVDPTTVLATGDLKPRYATGTLTGWVRCNGRTIGSATSGATELAHASAQTLFEHLWNSDTNLRSGVSGGSGASANADWLANKTIPLPDFRGRTLAALDDMGAAAAGRLTSTHWGANGIILGQSGGGESNALVTGNLPSHTHTGTTASSGAHTHDTTVNAGPDQGVGGGIGTSPNTTDTAYTSTSNGAHTHTFTTDATGSGNAFRTVQPTILITIYIKL